MKSYKFSAQIAKPIRYGGYIVAEANACFFDIGTVIEYRYPPQSIMIPTNKALHVILSSIQEIDPRSDEEQIKERVSEMNRLLEADEHRYVIR